MVDTGTDVREERFMKRMGVGVGIGCKVKGKRGPGPERWLRG